MHAGSRIAHFEVLGLIGSGGMGEVYRARDTRLGRDVAIKVLPAELAADPERLRRFEQEARAVAALSHPNILALYDVGTHEGAPYLVTELLEGESLRQRLQGGALPARKAVETAVQIAEGLAAAHEKGIVHRDLKPENVFLTKDVHVKLLDFGIAKLAAPRTAEELAKATTVTEVTKAGAVLGTVGYMSPEQLRGQAVDQRSDIFSFGCVLHEMLSGEPPFRGDTANDVMAAILKEDPLPLPGSTPPALQALVNRCLEKRPGERFTSAHDLALALRAFSGSADAPAAVAPGPVHRGVLPRGLWWPLAAVVVAVIAALAWRDVGGVRSRLLGGPTPHAVKLAVLPLANLSGDPEQEYLSEGLTQELITQLGRLHPESLSVIARTSVMRYRKTDKPVDQIGRELGVEYVLEGSARREGSRVRISAELIRAADQAQLWADSFERDLAGVLALETDIARKVAGVLALKLLPPETSRVASARAVNPDAHDAYLKGLQHWYKLTTGDLDAALRYFELALAKDPEYAVAHVGVALVWLGRAQMGVMSPAECTPRTKAAVAKALQLDETSAEAHYALASTRAWVDWDWPGADAEFRRAIELNPSYPDARIYYSLFLMVVARPDEGMLQARRALELDPFNALFHNIYAWDLMFVRRWDEAITQGRIAAATAPSVAGATLSLAFSAKGMRKEAAEAYRTAMKAIYDDPAVDAALGRGFDELGYEAAMHRAADALAARFRTSYAAPFDIATLYLDGGDRDRALDWLEKGFEIRDQNMPYLGLGFFDRIRAHPRFQALLSKMNLPTR